MSGDLKAAMTNKEMQEHFEKMVADHALDRQGFVVLWTKSMA